MRLMREPSQIENLKEVKIENLFFKFFNNQIDSNVKLLYTKTVTNFVSKYNRFTILTIFFHQSA